VPKGYVFEHFKEVFARYLPSDGKCEKSANDGPCSGTSGLSSRRIQELANWYSDQAYWHYSKNALAAGVLDAELRAILRKEVFPEHVEIEFGRVMKVVFAT
jgi:hypothetical protein